MYPSHAARKLGFRVSNFIHGNHACRASRVFTFACTAQIEPSKSDLRLCSSGLQHPSSWHVIHDGRSNNSTQSLRHSAKRAAGPSIPW